jgi:hypothetical protein
MGQDLGQTQSVFLVGLLLIWVALPLLPAILIYKLCPDGNVGLSGPLANLTVKASGAFAGYLIVLLVTFPVEQKISENVEGWKKNIPHQFWTVEVPIEFMRSDGKSIQNSNNISKLLQSMKVETDPVPHRYGTAKVTLRIVAPEGQLPLVTLKFSTFEDETIDLGNDTLYAEIDNAGRTIHIKGPIKIRPQRSREDQPTIASPVGIATEN